MSDSGSLTWSQQRRKVIFLDVYLEKNKPKQPLFIEKRLYVEQLTTVNLFFGLHLLAEDLKSVIASFDSFAFFRFFLFNPPENQSFTCSFHYLQFICLFLPR